MKHGGKRKHQKKRKKTTSELVYKDDGQEYARILRLLGGPNLEILCEDGIKRMGVIRGSMRNKVWVTTGDYLLVSLREFQDEKCDVLLKYTQENVRALKTYGEIKEELESVEEEEIEPFDFNDI
tara:strand:+ start:163 stop:534 length:372 start_codon:yes stop_codon:yes gene_type:complete